MIYDKARELAALLSNSPEYKAYKASREIAMENETTKALISQFHKLQLRVQAAMVAGEKDTEALEQLNEIGKLLQFNNEAAQFLLDEFKLNRMLGDVYKILAEAVDADLGMLET